MSEHQQQQQQYSNISSGEENKPPDKDFIKSVQLFIFETYCIYMQFERDNNLKRAFEASEDKLRLRFNLERLFDLNKSIIIDTKTRVSLFPEFLKNKDKFSEILEEKEIMAMFIIFINNHNEKLFKDLKIFIDKCPIPVKEYKKGVKPTIISNRQANREIWKLDKYLHIPSFTLVKTLVLIEEKKSLKILNNTEFTYSEEVPRTYEIIDTNQLNFTKTLMSYVRRIQLYYRIESILENNLLRRLEVVHFYYERTDHDKLIIRENDFILFLEKIIKES